MIPRFQMEIFTAVFPVIIDIQPFWQLFTKAHFRLQSVSLIRLLALGRVRLAAPDKWRKNHHQKGVKHGRIFRS